MFYLIYQYFSSSSPSRIMLVPYANVHYTWVNEQFIQRLVQGILEGYFSRDSGLLRGEFGWFLKEKLWESRRKLYPPPKKKTEKEENKFYQIVLDSLRSNLNTHEFTTLEIYRLFGHNSAPSRSQETMLRQNLPIINPDLPTPTRSLNSINRPQFLASEMFVKKTKRLTTISGRAQGALQTADRCRTQFARACAVFRGCSAGAAKLRQARGLSTASRNKLTLCRVVRVTRLKKLGKNNRNYPKTSKT